MSDSKDAVFDTAANGQQSAGPGDGGTERAVKAKRKRQRFSCAECRRLKIKCSKIWPCEACVKGGCAQICPDGQLWKSQGRRVFVGDSEDLKSRVALIKALDGSSASSSTSLSPKDADKATPSPRTKRLPSQAEDTVVGSTLGTLTIGRSSARYVGRLAGSEYLHEETETGESGRSSPDKTDASLPPDRELGWTVDLANIRTRLPHWETEGRALVEIYWSNVDWIQQAMPRPLFDSDFLISAYDSSSPPEYHKLACVFLVMALGVMYDLTKEPYHPRAKELFLLGKACLDYHSSGHASVATVQAILLQGTYILNDSQVDGAEKFWPMIGSAIKIAQSIGLHRDGTQFALCHYDTQVRRQVWWELVTYDRLQALCFGRPCASINRHSDTRFPEPSESVFSDKVGYHASKHRLAYMLEHVIDLQNQLAPLDYSSIKDLDAQLEDLKRTLPEDLLVGLEIEELPLNPSINPHAALQRFGIRLLISQTRLHLNRLPFSRALALSPLSPHTSPFGQSFLTLLNSAQEIVTLVKQLVFYHPGLIARWWAFWFHAYTSAVCLAAVVIQAPKSEFADQALRGMSIVCDLAAAARDGCRAKKGLKTLLKLRARAHDAMVQSAERTSDFPQHSNSAVNPSDDGRGSGRAQPYPNPATVDSQDETTPNVQAMQLTPATNDNADNNTYALPTFDPNFTFGSMILSPGDGIGQSPEDVLGFNIDDFLTGIRDDNFNLFVSR